MGWTRFFRRRFWDDERARELESYLEEETADNIARGLSPEEARRAARLKLGNVTLIREDIYVMNTIASLESVWQDFRYGARLLRRNPLFAAVAIAILALGTGANAAIFQLVDAVRLRTLPVERPGELVEVRIDTRGEGKTGRFISRRPVLSYRIWEQIRQQAEPFSSLTAWSNASFDLAGGGEVRPADGLFVTGSFFQTLGITPAVGRLISPDDDWPGCSQPGAVLGYAFWQRAYGGDPRVIGQTILLDGHRFDIMGVTPQGFFGLEVGSRFDVAVPLCAEPIFRPTESALASPTTWFLGAVGRLKPGWTVERASAQLRALSANIFRETLPDTYAPQDSEAYLKFQLDAVEASTGFSQLRGAYSTPLWVLLGVTALVLVIACANLANLMLARATAREREIGVRLAIGASRGRIARQLLSESLLLAALGAAAGLLLASWLSSFLVAFLDTDQRQVALDLSIDWRLTGFTIGIAVLASLLFGLAPAVRVTGAAPAGAVLGSRGATDSRERFTLRRVLVVVQVALSLVLLVGALLFARSLRNLMTVDPGFRHDGAILVSLDLRRADIPEAQQRTVYNDLVRRLTEVPGVAAGAEVAIPPLGGSIWNNRVVPEGGPESSLVHFNQVGPGYFRLLGTPLIAGRDFHAQDTLESPRVAIVNQTFASTVLPGGNAVGRRFSIEDDRDRIAYEVIGVVADTKYRNLRERPLSIAYLAATQDAAPGPFLDLLVRTQLPLGSVLPGLASAVRAVHPAITVQFQTMDGLVRNTLTSERLMAALSSFFGILAVLIATVGLYGVMSYSVARRRMEIGIRMALGATRADVVRMIVREAGVLLGVGLAVGAALAVAAARGAEALLFGLQPWDPPTLAFGAAGLGAVALAASWLPAYRASTVAPTAALRDEA